MEKKKETIKIFYCNECAEPLELNGGKIRFCPKCGVAPPVQDIFIKRICPECNTQVREMNFGDDYLCPNCNKVYTA